MTFDPRPLGESLACPDCGDADPVRLIHLARAAPCPRCRYRRGVLRAGVVAMETRGRERYCPVCEYSLQSGHWPKHVRSRIHADALRIVFGALPGSVQLVPAEAVRA